MFKLIPDKHFFKSYGKLPLQLRNQIDNKLLLLAENPYHPSLRTKRIQGSKRLFESSVNMGNLRKPLSRTFTAPFAALLCQKASP